MVMWMTASNEISCLRCWGGEELLDILSQMDGRFSQSGGSRALQGSASRAECIYENMCYFVFWEQRPSRTPHSSFHLAFVLPRRGDIHRQFP